MDILILHNNYNFMKYKSIIDYFYYESSVV